MEPDNNNAENVDDLGSLSELLKAPWYPEIMQKVEDALVKGSKDSSQGIVLEDDPEYQLTVDCTLVTYYLEKEIIIIYDFIRKSYYLKFPELESLVHHPLDYARVVKKIGNEVDLALVDLEGLLPSATIMTVSVAASTTRGKPLPEDVLQKTIDACDGALALESANKKVLDFLENKMANFAPNLSAIVGGAVAAKLVVAAGGLSSLANICACVVPLFGANEMSLAWFSTGRSPFHVGYLKETEIFQSTPPSLRKHACRLLAAKSVLAACIDSTVGDPSGRTGGILRAEIQIKIEKWQRTLAKRPALAVPYSEHRNRRVNRRLRNVEEK